jgi:signal transduction histidine kinase/GAF domain-containing protein
MSPLSQASAPPRVPEDLPDAPLTADTPFLAGDGEMARRMRALDWSKSPLGPPAHWPQSLKTAVGVCLSSLHPIEIWWGPEFVRLYNDGYRPILGANKHPQFLGRPGQECWGEIWDVIGPMLEGVRATGQATWSEDFPLMLERNGYLEETYFTFSYAPLREADGAVGGIFCACTETTARVLGERRLSGLRLLGSEEVGTATVEEVCAGTLKVLEGLPEDVAFALLYVQRPGEREARLLGSVRMAPGTAASPERLALDQDGPWPLSDVFRKRASVAVSLDQVSKEAFSGGKWPEAAREALVCPLAPAGGHGLHGVLVLGASPRRSLDVSYRGYFELASRQIAQSLASAQSREDERARARRAELGAAVGKALTYAATLPEQLTRCTQAIVQHLDAAFARIWVLNPKEEVLELAASAGLYTHLNGPHSRVPVGTLKIGRIAQSRQPHLTNDVLHDPQVGDKPWARREGMVSFAGYPLIIDGRLVGVMALFARQALDESTLQDLASIADSVAVGIERKRVDDERTALLAREQAALAEAELQRSRLHAFFMQAPAAICVLRGPDHVFELANPPYQALVGKTALVGKPLLEAMPELKGQPILPILDGVFHEAEPFYGNEYPVSLERNGRKEDCFFNFIYQPLVDPRGRVEGIAVVAFEVTEQVVARRRAEQLTHELAQSNQELDQFAYVASHDLKAPLRGIANLSQWIEEDLGDKLNEGGKEQMSLLRGRVHRLEALINGILSYSRAGRTREKLEEVDVGALLGEVRELLALDEATLQVGPGMPTLRTERVPMQQVFLNLVANAIKHAGRADPRVEIACVEEGDRFHFTVTDNGKGIAPEFHNRVWGIFQTLEARDKVEGTGIGLSVVKKIVETRGGAVGLDSSEGRGATFHVHWPKRTAASF